MLAVSNVVLGMLEVDGVVWSVGSIMMVLYSGSVMGVTCLAVVVVGGGGQAESRASQGELGRAI